MLDAEARRHVGIALLATPFLRTELHRSSLEAAAAALNRRVPEAYRIEPEGCAPDPDSDLSVLAVRRATGGEEYGRFYPSLSSLDPAPRAALALARLLTTAVLVGASRADGVYLSSKLRVGAEVLAGDAIFDELVSYSRIVSYSGRHDLEVKRLVGLTLLLADKEGQDVAHQWRQHLASLVRSSEEWALLDVRRVRSGVGFTVGGVPAVDVLREAQQAGAPLACTGLALALEILRWFES